MPTADARRTGENTTECTPLAVRADGVAVVRRASGERSARVTVKRGDKEVFGRSVLIGFKEGMEREMGG